MGRVVPTWKSFAAMRRDDPRNAMPRGSHWNLEDIIPGYGAEARERGGWTHHSNDIASITAASATYMKGGVYAIFSTSGGGEVPKSLALDEDGKLFDVTTANAASLIGTGHTVLQNPIFHGGAAALDGAGVTVYSGLVLILHDAATAAPKKYNGTTISSLGGTPPWARYGTVFKDYACLGNGQDDTIPANDGKWRLNRLWFSPPGDPDGLTGNWDLDNSFVDFSHEIKGLGATENALIVFGDDQLSRVRGSTPPPDSDFVVDHSWKKVGVLDAFSITEHEGMVYWCAPEGVFGTDGVSLLDLTKRGGMSRYWFDLLNDQSISSYSFAAGITNNRLIISVMNSTTFVDAFIIDLDTGAWGRLKNLDATSVWSGTLAGVDELYFGRRGAARVGALSQIFDVGDSSHKNDGDGDAVISVIETSFEELGEPGLKVIESVFLGYELTDYATDNPTATVSYIKTPEETSYTSLSPVLGEQTTYKRVRRTIGGRATGLALKITRAAAGDFLLYDIGVQVNPLEPSAR